MREILIIDCDVMIKLFDVLHNSNYRQLTVALKQLNARYSRIWVPQEVEREFIDFHKKKIKRKQRKKALTNIYNEFQFIAPCPIAVSDKEIRIANNNSDKNRGETDAMIQAGKVSGIADNRFNFSRIHLFLKDKGAIETALSKNLSIKRYVDFAEEIKEVGIILPT